MGNRPAPGWYADPSGQHRKRFWDGVAWTEMVDDGGIELVRAGMESLAAKDEAKLRHLISEGRKAADLLETRTHLKPTRIMSLEKTVRRAREAQNQLIGHNRLLVKPIVLAYAEQGVDLEDLVEEGNNALRRAAQTFDKQRTRFSPYAAMKIHEGMVWALKNRRQDDSAAVPEQTESVEEYIAAAEATDRLTADEEMRQASVIKQGRKATIKIERSRTQGKLKARADAIKQADRAKRLLFDRNRYVVIPIAREYVDQGMALMDLIEEGNHGLRRAIDKFEWREGDTLAAQADPYIRKAIIRGLQRAGRPSSDAAH